MSSFSSAFRARATWLHERGGPGWIAQGASSADVERRLRRWEHLVAGTRPERFARRLAWDGWTDRVPAMLSPGGQAGGTGDPHWFQLLERIVSADLTAVPLLADGGGDPERSPISDRLPFEEVLAPTLRIARTSLNDRIPPAVAARAELSPLVWTRFERHLAIELANLCADSLFEEFSRFRPAGYALLARMNVPPPAVPERAWYERFIASRQADHLVGYFERHPVLARLCAVVVGAWIDSTAEFVHRLADDRARIAAMVSAEVGTAVGLHLGPLVDVTAGLSDRHHGGRSVVALEFACGQRVIYKPRPLAMEAAWQRVLAWCNRSGQLPAELRVAGVCDRGDYGWMTFVDHQPCADERAVGRFYLRVGEMLCLLHVLRATDCHWENLVAAGEHPVLIDAETLLHPDMRPLEGETTPSGSAGDRYRHSVLRTGLLPRWEFDPALRQAVDVGGLTGGRSGDLRQTPDWVAVNTDHMARGVRRWPVQPRHLPSLGGRVIDSASFVDTIVSGFDAVYALLQRRAPDLLGASSVIEQFRGKPARFILRVTQLYQDVLSRALVKTSDALEASLEVDALARAFVGLEQRPSIWPALAAEHRALLQLDTPYFSATTDALDLCFDGGSVPSFFARTGMDDVLATVRALDDEDRRLQGGFIRAAFHARAARAGDSGPRGETPIEAGAPLTREEALAAAEAIARDIARRAIHAGDGSANWIGLAEIERAGCYQLTPLGVRLYDGVCGVALFLAAVDACSGGDTYRELTDAALHPLRRLIRDGGDRARQSSDALSIGAATGIGSLAYTLSLIADLRGDAELLDDAVRVAGWIDERRIAGDRHFDVLGGAAGAALALLAVYGLAGEAGLLHRASLCGEHLLANRSGPDGQRAWRTDDAPPLAGFSHGAAGIACALAQVAAATGDERFISAAREALAFERTLFSAEHRNWADVRAGRSPDAWYQVAWCHGAAGIALGRLGMLAGVDEPAVRDDLDAALATTAGAGVREVDHLCCGNAGRGDVLLEAGIRLGRHGLRDRAGRGAAAIVQRARDRGGYTIFPDVADRVVSVGFFQGTAGIGYHVLRLHHAALLPSVLGFDWKPGPPR